MPRKAHHVVGLDALKGADRADMDNPSITDDVLVIVIEVPEPPHTTAEPVCISAKTSGICALERFTAPPGASGKSNVPLATTTTYSRQALSMPIVNW